MTKIREIIQINSGYTSNVDLYDEYNDLVKNRGRMARYQPIQAHRKAFEKIAEAFNPLDRRFYFLSGSYGTGKSHLLLMLANYFANPSDVPEIKSFFENYQEAQANVLLKPGESLKERSAKSLQEARKSGRYLVALCRYSLNLDFESTLLQALEEVLEKDESNLVLDSHYHEALRRIKNWEERRNKTRFYTDFESAISNLYPELTVNKLVAGLEEFKESALSAFKTCFRKVTDTDFGFNKDNLRDIITDLLSNPTFKEKYLGIVFLYDEFGAAIDANLVKYLTLLDFAQFCQSSTFERGGSVIFVGAGHKTFTQHGKIGDLNAETLAARVTEVGLETQGMEDIIAAVVQPLKNSPEWEEIIQSPMNRFTWYSKECNRLQLFNWLPAPKIKMNIIQNIYPMHPLATFSLLQMAKEVGSDNRSITRFFAPEFETGEEGWKNVQPYSYPDFIEKTDIFENGKISLYTAELLVEYFKDSLKVTNTKLTEKVKTSIINYEATLREMNTYLSRQTQQPLFDEADELMLRILKVMLVNEISSTQGTTIANTAQNIEFALDYESESEKTAVEQRLKKLSAATIIYNDEGIYKLMQGDRKDVHRLVDQYKSNPDNRPHNLLQKFLDLNPLRGDDAFIEAKDYNSQFSEDKRMKVVFVTPEMMETQNNIDGLTLPFFAALEHERLSISTVMAGYEGIAVHVFCENDTDIERAKNIVAQNDQPRISVAIPCAPIIVYDAIFTINALNSDLFQTHAQDFGPFEKALEKQIRDKAMTTITEARAAYFSNSKVNWFGKDGIEIPVQENRRHDVANRLMHEFYGKKRNAFGHNEFNKCHINLSGQVKAILKEAGDVLCDTTQSIRLNWTWADNRGPTKYLRRCFVEHQILKIFNTEGDIRYLEPEKDLNKFRTEIPAYADMIEKLSTFDGKDAVDFKQFIQPYFREFGQGEIAITLMLLLARRFYGDSLRFKNDPNALSDLQFNTTEEMLYLVQGNSPTAVLLFEPVSTEDQAYFAKITQTFSDQVFAAGKVYSIKDAFQAIKTWWSSLPIIARSIDLYPSDEKNQAKAFSQTQIKDAFQFIKHDMMELLGYTPGEILSPEKIKDIEETLHKFKVTAESIQSDIENKIFIGVAEIFNIQSHLDLDIQEAFKNWHNGLSGPQKDPMGEYHNNDSKPLVRHTAYINIRELLFKTLPVAYSFETVENWSDNCVESYLSRIQKGKNHIETNAPQVGQLITSYSNDISHNGDQITYKGELRVHTKTEDGKGIIYYTEDGSDPVVSPHRLQLSPGDTLIIKGNQKIKLVVADEKGNYSAVKIINAIDDLQKYKITRRAQKPMFDEMISFVFPEDKQTANITLSSLLQELSDAGFYSDEELKQFIDKFFSNKKK